MSLKPIVAAGTPPDATSSDQCRSPPVKALGSGSQKKDAQNSELPRPVVLPPRAKPGRKPVTDTPVNKRKAQNREAQRNFRERKKQKEEASLEVARKLDRDHLAVIQQMQEQHEQEMKQLRDRVSLTQQREMETMKAQLQEQNKSLKVQQKRNDELHAQLQQLLSRQNASGASSTPNITAVPLPPRRNKSDNKSLKKPASQPSASSSRATLDAIVMGSTPPTPPAEEAIEEPMEIDFTNPGKPSTEANGGLESVDEWCGFCQNNTYCACKGRLMHSDGLIRIDSYSKPSTLEPSAAPVGPGSCKACLDDPERRRICLSMARKSQDGQDDRQNILTPGSASGAPSYGSTYVAHAGGKNWQDSHMSCTDAITYGRIHDPNFRENWTKDSFIQQLRVTPHREDQSETPHNAAQDVEIASIMAAMSTSGPNPQRGT